MYFIVVYDVEVRRCRKVLKICRKYLHQVLRSAFEGYLTQEQYSMLKSELRKVIDEEYDSIYFYIIKTGSAPHKLIIGEAQGEKSMIE
ncbi:CRISPR-associated protein Cas2 [Fervidobacterium nodosum Rt17-B1]|uniref:CRISPR-associated endoribonuclease Cas2 n=2 Tax=Fervidobacterium nodosum TaxID=2424 RepID=A7HMW0_FERNB|nr:CRISPR-associated endonuclease Cas2 [Fervidobacterium nodosum]ABS61243.1 CRISPR-associated protein Cas2 [Fervidobacterium nodosum Rt17-B1]